MNINLTSLCFVVSVTCFSILALISRWINVWVQMLRKSSNNCCICLGDEQRSKIQCDKKHSMCQTCFPKYIESLCENYPKLKSNNFKVRCPLPNCTSGPFTDGRLLGNLDPKLYKRLKDVIEQDFDNKISNSNTSSVWATFDEAATITRILDTLTLKCPKCKHAVDPNPDGCAAIICPHCAGNFCGLCFTQTIGDAHPHVLICEFNTTTRQYQDYFPSRALKDAAHKVYRLNALTTLLQPLYRSAKLCTAALDAMLNKVSPSLARCDITCDELMSKVAEIATTSSSSSRSSRQTTAKKKGGMKKELRNTCCCC